MRHQTAAEENLSVAAAQDRKILFHNNTNFYQLRDRPRSPAIGR